jgi:pyruvate/2-oxoglutarate dehydrogenase complex dihydrolipoamide acyltransferase (E2) component
MCVECTTATLGDLLHGVSKTGKQTSSRLMNARKEHFHRTAFQKVDLAAMSNLRKGRKLC